MSVHDTAYSPATNEVYYIGGYGTGDYVKVYGLSCACIKNTITISAVTSRMVYDPLNSNMYIASYSPAERLRRESAE
jgi:hypothetical protein